MTAPFFPQRQHVAVKDEVTEGTDSSPGDADVIAPAFDIAWEPTFETPERNALQSSFSKLPRVTGERSAQISFAVELKGASAAGTVPPQLSVPLQACGFSETIVASTSVTYAPTSNQPTSVTVEIREGSTDSTAKSKKITGARGTVSFEAVKGNRVMALFVFTGNYVEPADGATNVFTSPAPGVAPIPFLNASLSFHALGTLLVQNVTLDMANNVVMRNDANQATGNFSAVITNRSPIGSLDPEEVLVATMNFPNRLTSNTEGALSYVLTGSAGNVTTVNAPKAQIINLSEADRDGIRTAALELQLNQSATAGDDEISIAFT